MKLKLDNGKTIQLALHPTWRGVAVTVVDEKGDRLPQGYLIDITTGGEIYRRQYVGRNFGFKLVKDGKVKKAKE